MKLGTYVAKGAAHFVEGRAGILVGERVLDLAALGTWASRNEQPA